MYLILCIYIIILSLYFRSTGGMYRGVVTY